MVWRALSACTAATLIDSIGMSPCWQITTTTSCCLGGPGHARAWSETESCTVARGAESQTEEVVFKAMPLCSCCMPRVSLWRRLPKQSGRLEPTTPLLLIGPRGVGKSLVQPCARVHPVAHC